MTGPRTCQAQTTDRAIERRTEEFLERVHAGQLVEPRDWMPDEGPTVEPEVHRSARQQRNHGRPARARVDRSRSDTETEALVGRQGPGRGRTGQLALASGTDEQFAMLQEAVIRWWEPIMHFFGTDIPAEQDPSIHWRIKPQTNETSRQAWMSQYIPKLWDLGIAVPDANLHWDQRHKVWHYTEPVWERLREIVKGEGTEATRTRLWWRQQIHRHHGWIRDILLGADDGVVTIA